MRTAAPDAVPSILPLVGVGGRQAACAIAVSDAHGSGPDERAEVSAPGPLGPLVVELPAGKPEPEGLEPRLARPTHQITCDDPRVPELEQLLDRGDWAHVVELLGPPGDAGRLPPPLGLVYAIARKELEAASLAAPDESVDGPNQLARRCMAALLAVSEESPLALVLARRLLRQNPISWRRRRAPAAHVSFIIIIVALLLGAGVGYVLSFGRITLLWPG